MFIMLIASIVAAFALLCVRIPSVWSALMAIDEPSDAREMGLVVASRTFCISSHHTTSPSCPPSPRPLLHGQTLMHCLVLGNPFRESGPPACMAKLIMMRHKVRGSSSRPSTPPPRRSFLRAMSYAVLTPIARSVKPDQHPKAAHHGSRAASYTAPVRVSPTAPTACTVDPRPQTFRSTAPLTGILSLPLPTPPAPMKLNLFPHKTVLQ